MMNNGGCTFQNTGVPLRFKHHCTERSDVIESDSNSTLEAFKASKGGSLDILRHSADTAFLLTGHLDDGVCGRAFFDASDGSDPTLGIGIRDCALGYFSFAHEMAHILGARHNRENAPDTHPYGHGFLVGPKVSTVMQISLDIARRVCISAF